MANSTAQHSTAQHSTAQHSTALRLRLATIGDAETLLEWRNDPSTRKASHSSHTISKAEHIQWLEGILSNQNRTLYIAEIDGSPVGTARADYENPGYELSWTISPKKRGLGIGQEMVRILAEIISAPIRAEIKVGNVASVRIAEASGLILVSEKNGILHYQRGAAD